jgi:hypothetical protein
MGFLKPKAPKSSSSNINNDLIKSTYSPQMQAGTGATNFLAQLLGVSPGGVSSTADKIGTAANGIAEGGGAQAGYQNYLQQAGFAPAMREMSRGVTGQGAAAGLLRSGATAKALQSRGTELNQSFFNNYLQQLAGLSGLGLQGGGLVANTGQQSTSKGGSPSTLGSIASTVGGIASIFSDRRLKRDIERVGEFPDGLGIYSYRYVMGAKRILGVMADEIAKLRPWALGPKIAGYSTVDYSRL